jgi:C1A family cysteine protease
MKKQKQSSLLKHVSESEPLPNQIDWNEKKKVSRVKNQAKCGSCWAFSATGALESMLRIKHNKNIDLSEQQLLDCSFSNHGCHGGLMDLAFQDINTLGGIESSESYPYLGEKKQCRVDYRRQVPQIGFIDYDYIEPLNTFDMKQKLVHHGPFCSAVEVSSMDFMFYKEGIYDVTSKKNHDLNHAVLLTGYSERKGDIPHWHLKNSWGKDWGEDGFMRIAMRDGEGVCGINIYGVYLK